MSAGSNDGEGTQRLYSIPVILPVWFPERRTIEKVTLLVALQERWQSSEASSQCITFVFKNTHYGHLCLDELQYHKWSVFVWTYGRYDGIIQKLVCGVRICWRLRLSVCVCRALVCRRVRGYICGQDWQGQGRGVQMESKRVRTHPCRQSSA